MNKIQHSLKKIFEDQRIVLWYAGEEEQEMNVYFDELELDNITKIKVENDEFAVKYRVLKKEPNKKFLLFIPHAQPSDRGNWLLDLCLANHIFSTDESAIYLQELGLDIEFKPLITEHLAFFKNKDRRAALKRIINRHEDFAKELRYKMLAVVTKSDPTLEALLMSFISEAAEGKNNQIEQAGKYNLLHFFWKELARRFNYDPEAPSIQDFVKAVFQTQSSTFLPREKARLNREAIVFLKRWKDSARNQESFKYFSEKLAHEWKVEKWLENLSAKDLEEADLFELIDQKILADIKQGILSDLLTYSDANAIIERRRQKYWYAQYQFHYEAIEAALSFFELMRTVDFRFSTSAEAAENYINHYFKIDKAYRQYYQALKKAGNPTYLASFTEQIEKQYGNQYLMKLNDRWQEKIDAQQQVLSKQLSPFTQQRHFWQQYITPYLEKENRIFVIISDALRYEAGADLCARLLKEARFEASIEPMIATVPTFTQLGMAALLPHEELTLEGKGSVIADGISTQGTYNRDKILNQSTKNRAKAITAGEFIQATTPVKPIGRNWIKDFDVIYIYSNTIDKAGEEEEEKLFHRIEEEFDHIFQLLKQIVNTGGNNVIITADHGFLYQTTSIAESDFANFKVEGKVSKQNRRFVLGHQLKTEKGAMHFSSEDLGLHGDTEVVIPKSINRLRQQGSGSRYVHGGMSLQELIVPVIHFSKKRSSEADINLVDVELIRTSSRITSNQIVLSFYQKQAVQGKWHARELRLGFYDQNGVLISDNPTIRFDSTESSERKREKKQTFHFSKLAENYHNKEVYLRLEDLSGGKYDEIPFTMMISFTSDFDDFNL
jgi:uncharacterized protein (TIGR02687 family)